MKNFIWIFTSLCVLSLAACEPKAVDTTKEGEKLMQASREWSKDASARDIEKILSYWADDAIVISAGEPEMVGKGAIRGMVEEGFKDPNFNISWEPQSVEISKSGDMGYLLEDAIITMKDSTGNSMSQHFKSVTIWKKQADGSWKNVVDVMSPKAAD
jgi:ketosteroid isomerase-like protein